MNPQTFIDNFSVIANAPGGVQRLREMILQLAVMGKLTEQDPNDEPASELFERIERIREKLSSTKKIKKERNIQRVRETEILYQIPDQWIWCRFGSIWELISGRDLTPAQYNSNKRGVPYITGASNIEDNEIIINRWTEVPAVLSETNDLLISCKGTIGKTVFNLIGEAHIARQIMAIRAFSSDLSKRYLKIWLDSYVGILTEKSISMIPGFSRSDLLLSLFPLPPLEEQKRIVTKVDQLMALCDRLEEQQRKRSKLVTNTRVSALEALANAQKSDELRIAWNRVEQNLSMLFEAPEDIENLKDTIKTVGVMGHLVSEIEEYVDVEKIKKDTQDLKNAYQKKKWIRAQKKVSLGDYLITYPTNWSIQRFDDVAIVIGGVTKGRKLANRKTKDYPYLRVANVQRGFFDLSKIKTISIPVEEFLKYEVLAGDILVAEGGDWDKVGRAAIWNDQIENCLHQNHIFKIRLASELIDNRWVELVFNSNIGREYFAGASKQTTNLASINMTQIRSFAFPIPPMDEQTRIIERVSKAIHFCDTLESQLNRSRKKAEQIVQSIVESLTGISTQKKEKMKAPKTELVTQLMLATKPDVKDQAPLSALLVQNNDALSAKRLWNSSGMPIDDFYRQLKIEMRAGWISEPQKAEVHVIREKAGRS